MPDHDRHRKSDNLDNYLNFSFYKIHKKYRWRRIELFRQFLSEWCKMSEREIDDKIASIRQHGINDQDYEKWSFVVEKWHSKFRKKRGENSANTRWKKPSDGKN